MFRIVRRIASPIPLALALIVLAPVASPAQEPETAFPRDHAVLLSGSAYRALFGVPEEPLPFPGALPLATPAPAPDTAELGGDPPVVGANRQVSDPQLAFPDGLLGRSETTIAGVAGGLWLVAGWNDAEGFCGPPRNIACPAPPVPGMTGYAVSRDGGLTWTDGGAPPPGTRIAFGPGAAGVSATGRFVTAADPSLDASGPGPGTLWYANVGFFDDFGATFVGVTLHPGRFGSGGSFAWGEPFLLQSPNFPRDTLDKEHVEADGSSLYVSVTNFVEVGGIPSRGLGQIDFFHSQDDGATWGRSIVQPDETISATLNRGIVNQGSEPAVGPDGEVYVVWQRGFLSPFFGQLAAGVLPQIRFSRSLDGGATWQPAAAGPPSSGVNPAGVLVTPLCSGDLFPPAGYNRTRNNTVPRIAVDPYGLHRGRIYVVFNDCRIANGGVMPAPPGPEDVANTDVGHADTDVYLMYSDDRGATWSAPVLVSGGGDGLIQFWPTISVGPAGVVDVTWSESFEPNGTGFQGAGAGTSLVDIYWARSTDGGESFGAPVRITEVTSDWAATASDLVPNFGDYNDAVTFGQRLLTTWADGRNGVPDVFFARAKGTGGSSE
jgi:hypothetical protein